VLDKGLVEDDGVKREQEPELRDGRIEVYRGAEGQGPEREKMGIGSGRGARGRESQGFPGVWI